MGGACAKHDRDVDAFHVHSVQHGLGVFAATLFFRANIASELLVAVVCLVASYFSEALPFRAIDVSGKHLPFKTPDAWARAVRDIGKLRSAVFELRLDIPGPQITRLLHVNVTVHDFKAVLHSAILDLIMYRRPQ